MKKSTKVEFYRQTHSLIKKLRRRSMRELDIYKSGEFYPSDFRVLSILDEEKGTSIGEITKRWSMQYSNVTNIVNSLVQKGFAIKRKGTEDKRKSIVFITPEGNKLKDEIFVEFDKKISECLSNVDDEKIETALAAVNSILEQL